jgi:hypothetical protein
MINRLDVTLLLATLVRVVWLLVGISTLYLIWRIIKMAAQQTSFTVNIIISAAAPPPLAPVSNPLNLSGTVGQPFSAALQSNLTGGTPPYNLTVTGTPPDGLTVDASGNVTGTPTTPGTSTLNVSVTDSGS